MKRALIKRQRLLKLNTQRVREFEPRRLRFFFASAGDKLRERGRERERRAVLRRVRLIHQRREKRGVKVSPSSSSSSSSLFDLRRNGVHDDE